MSILLGRISVVLVFALHLCFCSLLEGKTRGLDSRRPIRFRTAEGVQFEERVLRSEEVKIAGLVRTMIDSLCRRAKCEDLLSQLRTTLTREVIHSDSTLGTLLLQKLSGDSSFIKDCLYVADLKRNWKSVESKHFIFYFQDEDLPDASKTQEWDSHFERLARAFGTHISEKIPYKIDRTEKYGRSFPPWEVKWEIRWREVGDNPHELVHIMLFKYSDVPFFYEPLAFIYGTYKGDSAVVAKAWSRYEKTVADSGYVSATQLLHFSALIGLHESKRASAFYFVRSLLEEGGIRKLLRLMSMTPWKSSVDDFTENFRKVYGVELKDFEENALKGGSVKPN